MIYESHPWRESLRRDADILERWLPKRSTERRSFIVEQKVFLAAYAMRRLIQSNKLSTDLPKRQVPCATFVSLRPITLRRRWEFDEHYDLDNPVWSTLAVSRVLNLLIHSFIFVEGELNEGVPALLFTSDSTRNKALYGVEASSFVDLMRTVANDNPPTWAMRCDPVSRDWEIWAGEGKPPGERE